MDETHHATCSKKLEIIQAQSAQLMQCLDMLLQEVVHQTRTFKVYRQFKMYNSADLNPELYVKESVLS